MFWRREMMLPITREELEANEEAWLDSGESDEYGSCSYFIHRFYTDDEKQALWDERGDKNASIGGRECAGRSRYRQDSPACMVVQNPHSGACAPLLS